MLANGRAEWSLFSRYEGAVIGKRKFFSAENFIRQKRCISSHGSGN